jgi:DNA-binding NarL/FixJ family response regulator
VANGATAAGIRVVLADDHTLVRQGIGRLLALAGGFDIVGEASDGDEALSLISRLRPQVVLLDVRMPRLSGLDVLRALPLHSPETAALLLTTFDEDSVVLEAVRLGAKGFLLKDVSLDQLATAVREIAGGGSLIRPVVTERILRGLEAKAPAFESAEQPEALTQRERDVLRLMAAGHSNREIGDALGTTEGTVKNQASSILSKLGVRDRTRAVLKAIELGWV